GSGRTRPALDAGFFIVREFGSRQYSSQHRLQIDVALRRERRCSGQQLRTEQRSLTTEGSRHALRECQGSRNATTANLLENSAMWKGELASTRASVSPRQQWRTILRRKPCEKRRRAARPFNRGSAGSQSNGTCWVSFMVKLLRAYGGCLGANRR